MSKADAFISLRKSNILEENMALTCSQSGDVNQKVSSPGSSDVGRIPAETESELHDGCIVLGANTDSSNR